MIDSTTERMSQPIGYLSNLSAETINAIVADWLKHATPGLEIYWYWMSSRAIICVSGTPLQVQGIRKAMAGIAKVWEEYELG